MYYKLIAYQVLYWHVWDRKGIRYLSVEWKHLTVWLEKKNEKKKI